MSITVQLSPVLETQLLEKAARRGMSLDKFIALTLESVSQKQVKSEPTEADLLEKINLGISQKLWEEYRQLKSLRKSAQLNEAQHQRLVEISDRIEAANVRRVKYLVKLAKLRNLPLPKLMDELKIRPANYE